MKYFWATIKHKWFILLACRKVGVPLWRAIVHDLSKFTPAELPHYNRSFFGDRGDPRGFAVAWLHHQNHNPHHPEYWYTRSDISKVIDGTAGYLPMPWPFVREMVADWLAASRAYTGSWDISKWLKEELPRREEKMHPYTRQRVGNVLTQLGYLQGGDE